MALGSLLETVTIAASTEWRKVSIPRRPDTPETHLLFDVVFQREEGLACSPLAACIEKRVVQRRPMSTRQLSAAEKMALAKALPEGYSVAWYEGFPQRWRMAKFMFDNAKVRLTIPEAYAVHKSVIEWGARFSTDKIPDQAVGVDPLTARFMHWAMASWGRIGFFNTYLLGHLPPRIQLDLLPGLRCGAHFALLSPAPLKTVDDYIAAGRAMQRFWLTTTRLGWLIQPEMTPVIFTRYIRQQRTFTTLAKAVILTATLNRRLLHLLGKNDIDTLFFMGRTGAGPEPSARSLRKTLSQLLGDAESHRALRP